MPSEKVKELRKQIWIESYPSLVTNDEEKKFYSDLFMPKKGNILKQDIISHFTCRMLYCKEASNHQKFIEMER